MVYTSEADKGALLAFLEAGYPLRVAAKKAGIPKSTAYNIKKKAGEIEIQHIENNLSPPTRQQQLAIRPKIGRPPALLEEDKDKIFEVCTKDRESRKQLQHLIVEEEGFRVSRRLVEKAMRERRLGRPKSTKKLFLIDIQRAQRYELAISCKDWGLQEWRKVVFLDEAAILVGEHRGFQRVSRTPKERFHPNVIEVRYNNYLEAMFWGYFSYNYKGPCHIYIEESSVQTAD